MPKRTPVDVLSRVPAPQAETPAPDAAQDLRELMELNRQRAIYKDRFRQMRERMKREREQLELVEQQIYEFITKGNRYPLFEQPSLGDGAPVERNGHAR